MVVGPNDFCQTFSIVIVISIVIVKQFLLIQFITVKQKG